MNYPRLTLRLGFAGSKNLTAGESDQLRKTLAQIYSCLGEALLEVQKKEISDSGSVTCFYSNDRPLLRLVTGLCEGADTRAAETLADVEAMAFDTEQAAVLPFPVADYRAGRSPNFLPAFDALLTRCAYVLALDGRCDKPSTAELEAIADPMLRQSRLTLANKRRARGYRAQSALLLRHCDMLIAAADPGQLGKAGGTLETVREALVSGLPVVFVHLDSDAVCLIEPQSDWRSALSEPTPDWSTQLAAWVHQLCADPDVVLTHPYSANVKRQPDHMPDLLEHGRALLNEYFERPDLLHRGATNQRVGLRGWVWNAFSNRFTHGSKPKIDPLLEPYASYRKRATVLNHHYGGLYRGAFLLNYGFAIATVLIAALSLALLGNVNLTAANAPPIEIAHTAGVPASDVLSRPSGGLLLPTLFGLAVIKLLLLTFIWYNTGLANKLRWNDRGVDYRYLAERLRGMYYLPLLGSFRPPAAAAPQFALRGVRQSTVDWLFEAIVRSISPADLPQAVPETVAGAAIQKLIKIDPCVALTAVRDSWVGEQAAYHERNALTMNALRCWSEHCSMVLSIVVIGVVLLDLLLVGIKLFAHPPEPYAGLLKQATIWLIFVSAVLPAMVSALAGIRFQSECQRLAERSQVMSAILHGRGIGPIKQGRWQQLDRLIGRISTATAYSDTDPGAWSGEAVSLGESVAADFAQEVAEWSTLYAKELSDPG